MLIKSDEIPKAFRNENSAETTVSERPEDKVHDLECPPPPRFSLQRIIRANDSGTNAAMGNYMGGALNHVVQEWNSSQRSNGDGSM